MEANQYPDCLIPKTCWHAHIETSDLLGLDMDVYVARRIEGKQENCIDDEFGADNAFLKADALKNSDIPNMSLSLLGALFETNALRFRQTRQAMDNWNGQNVDTNALIENCVVECDNPWFAVAWNVTDLHNKVVPYKIEFTKEKDYNKLLSNINKVAEVISLEFADYKQAIYPLQATTKLNHSPALLNYWHFTFDIYPMGSETPIYAAKSGWEKSLTDKVAKQCLRYSFHFANSFNVTPIPSRIWKKNV